MSRRRDSGGRGTGRVFDDAVGRQRSAGGSRHVERVGRVEAVGQAARGQPVRLVDAEDGKRQEVGEAHVGGVRDRQVVDEVVGDVVAGLDEARESRVRVGGVGVPEDHAVARDRVESLEHAAGVEPMPAPEPSLAVTVVATPWASSTWPEMAAMLPSWSPCSRK